MAKIYVYGGSGRARGGDLHNGGEDDRRLEWQDWYLEALLGFLQTLDSCMFMWTSIGWEFQTSSHMSSILINFISLK